MNDALAAVVDAQSKKVSCSSNARQYKSSAPRTRVRWPPAQKSLCVQLFLEGNYNHRVLRYGCRVPPLITCNVDMYHQIPTPSVTPAISYTLNYLQSRRAARRPYTHFAISKLQRSEHGFRTGGSA